MIGKFLYLIKKLYDRIERFAKDRKLWFDFSECKDHVLVYTGIDKLLNLHFSLYYSDSCSRILVLTLRDLSSSEVVSADVVNQIPFLYQILKYCSRGNKDNCFMEYLVENIIKHASYYQTTVIVKKPEELGITSEVDDDVISSTTDWRGKESAYFYDPDSIELRIIITK